MKSKNLTRKSSPLTQQKEKHRSFQNGVTGHLVLKNPLFSVFKKGICKGHKILHFAKFDTSYSKKMFKIISVDKYTKEVMKQFVKQKR